MGFFLVLFFHLCFLLSFCNFFTIFILKIDMLHAFQNIFEELNARTMAGFSCINNPYKPWFSFFFFFFSLIQMVPKFLIIPVPPDVVNCRFTHHLFTLLIPPWTASPSSLPRFPGNEFL
jgi:hypothetical protein